MSIVTNVVETLKEYFSTSVVRYYVWADCRMMSKYANKATKQLKKWVHTLDTYEVMDDMVSFRQSKGVYGEKGYFFHPLHHDGKPVAISVIWSIKKVNEKREGPRVISKIMDYDLEFEGELMKVPLIEIILNTNPLLYIETDDILDYLLTKMQREYLFGLQRIVGTQEGDLQRNELEVLFDSYA